MSFLSGETHLTFAEAASRAPGKPHIATIWRWAMKGVRGVRLESFCCGAKRLTSVEALERFVCRTTEAAGGTLSDEATESSRKREIAKAEAACEAAGI